VRRNDLAVAVDRLPPVRDPAEVKRPVNMAKNTRELGVDRVVVNDEGATIAATPRVVWRDQEHVLQHREGA
jgi:hypothetical protein